MNQQSPQILGKSLSAMTTAELEALLQAEMDSDQDVDVEKVKAIAAVLDERTQDEINVDAAWDSFVHNHLPYNTQYQPEIPETAATLISTQSSKESDKRRIGGRKRALRIGLIAAVLVVALSVSATALHFDFWNVVVQWTSETFGLSFGEKRTNQISESPEYAKIKAALDNNGVTVPLVPRYLPDGYTLSEFYSDGKQYIAYFENQNSEISIQIHRVYGNIGRQYEMDSGSDETYIVAGIDHIISTNMGFYQAVWVNSEYECSISNVPSKEELLLMIDSIYMEG